MAINIKELLSMRQLTVDPVSDWRLFCRVHAHGSLVERLGFAAQLEGHRGCVNCLEWNSDGSLLVSGSDDLTAIVWDPHQHKPIAVIPTGHTGNIFSVKFVPFSGDHMLLTGAEDKEVRLHDITTMETTRVWSCSQSRVKRIATSPSSPFLCWSAAEDACVRQLDIREPHSCHGDGSCRNVLIDLKPSCNPNPTYTQCKCVAVNAVRPEQIAVGALDPFVRLYDARVMSLTKSHKELKEGPVMGCLAYFTPGNISNPRTEMETLSRRGMPTIATTYVTFSPDGTELLTNMSCEQIYIYDLTNYRESLKFDHYKATFNEVTELHRNPGPHLTPASNCLRPLMSPLQYCHSIPIPSSTVEEDQVSEEVKAVKDKGNMLYRSGKLTEAIEMYSRAIALNPLWHIPYSNRATAFYGRKWDGDYYAALRDAEKAIVLCPLQKKAHMRRLRCMHMLGWYDEGLRMLEKFRTLFPEENEFSSKMNLELEKASALSISKTLLYRNGYGNRRRNIALSQWECSKEFSANDYSFRLCGHSNAHTDIKEANYIGERGEYIAAGSDDGNVFIWEKATGNIVRVLNGDDSIVNCVQWHPAGPVLATSGIENMVRLWEPKPVDYEEKRCVKDVYKACRDNQQRMKVDPFEVMLMRMGFNIGGMEETRESPQPRRRGRGEQRDDSGHAWIEDRTSCRQS